MSIWQTSAWQEMLKKSNQVQHTIELDFSGKKIYIEKRNIALKQYGLFIIGYEGEVSGELQQKLQQICTEQKCLFIQIETIDYQNTSESQQKYYKKFITPYTAVIDLQLSDDEILIKMKQKGRYNIRLGEKKGVTVQQVEINEKNINVFYDLMTQTTTRDKFAGNTKSYYTTFLQDVPSSALLFAEFEREVIAAGIFVFHEKTAIYYYGASSSEKIYRKYMAPYSLQWKAIQLAKQYNCEIYDFLGVAGPDETNSPLAGVTDFKTKLTPDIRYVSSSYIFIRRKVLYFVIACLRKLKK